ncbi:MAG: TetR/AcrR family transcriptional regulator [Bacteroidota bacterium]|jgi:AcrR family transcriptional regulator|nr:TetR/AcrR family transcriptional regulator [Bacteroidota bacterium]
MRDLFTPDKKKSAKEKIAHELFKVFLRESFERITIREFEKYIDKTRGSVYHHFKDKNNLFYFTIDTYFFSNLNALYFVSDINTSLSLREYILLREKHLSDIWAWFAKEYISLNPLSGFHHLLLQANKHYPLFQEKVQEVIKKDINGWSDAVCKGIADNELKKEISPTEVVELFQNLYFSSCAKNDVYSNSVDFIEAVFSPLWTFYSHITLYKDLSFKP